jgi:hypothetical protein
MRRKSFPPGRGIWFNQVVKVKKLGVRPSKSLPPLLEELADATDGGESGRLAILAS